MYFTLAKTHSNWGFTVYTDKQQWHFCCEKREVQVSWAADIIRAKFGSDICLKSISTNVSAVQKASTLASGTVPLSNDSSKKLTDKTIGAGEGPFSKPAKVGSMQQKNNTIANCLRHADMFKAPDLPRRKTSMDTGQPQMPPSLSPVTSLPPSGYKNTGKKASLGGDAMMPANLLNELNCVLSKSGRTAKNSE